MSKYVLTYFPVAGRAEPIRLALTLAGADWEDKRITMEQWPAMKAESTTLKPFRFPWLPLLEVVGENIVVSQSLPALRFVARRFGFDGKTEAEKVYVDSIVELSADIIKAYSTLFFSKDPEKDAKEVLKKVADCAGYVEVILGDNAKSGYIIGDKITVADLAIFAQLRGAQDLIKQKANTSLDLDKFPNVKKHLEKIAAEPKIKAYYNK